MTDPTPDPFAAVRDDVDARRQTYLETVEPFRPELFRYARGLTGSPWDAEDLVQETLTRVFSGLGTHSGRVANVRACLFRVATNCWIDHQRRRRPAVLAPEDMDAPTENEPLGPEVREALERLAMSLPPRERAAVLLKDVFDFSLKEAAGALRTTVGAVKSALHRRRAALGSAPAAPRAAKQERPTLDAWVDAFNRRDVDGLLTLMTDECQIQIPGVVDDTGPAMGRSVLANTLAEEGLLRAERVEVLGESIAALWYAVEGGEAIGDVVRLETEAGRITRLVSYYFSPDVLAAVADALAAHARPQGYRM